MTTFGTIGSEIQGAVGGGKAKRDSLLAHLWIFLKEAFGIAKTQLPVRFFALADIERYHLLNAADKSIAVDDATLADLAVGDYTERFFPNISIFGQQVLYDRFRRGGTAAENAVSKTHIDWLINNRDQAASVTETCVPLRRSAAEISGLLYADDQTLTPAWTESLWLVQAAAVFSFFGTMFSWYFAIAFCTIFVFVVCLQLRSSKLLSQWDEQHASLMHLFDVSSALERHFRGKPSPFAEVFARDAVALAGLGAQLRTPMLIRASLFVGEYANWFFLSNIARYYRSLKVVAQNRSLLQGLYQRVSELEAELAIASHLAERRFCWARQTCTPEVRLADVYNPFLDEPMPLDIELVREGIFLSGRNGIGKSTLLRTLGLNLIVGRAYGFCYAQDALVPLLPLMTSIKVEDSLDAGTSLYIAELQRAQAMVQASRAGLPCIFIIDEIFRGTNHIDSVSASAAVLSALSKTHSLVVVSSHNLILASILKQRLRPMLVDYLPHRVPAKLQLAPGVLLEPNALTLLTSFDFGAQIERDATSVQEWLSNYLTYPSSAPMLS